MIIFLREWEIQIINLELKNVSCREKKKKKKNHNTLYKILNNIDHLKKKNSISIFYLENIME